MKRILLYIIAALLVGACASSTGREDPTTDLDRRLSSWSGAPVIELADVIGEPTRRSDTLWEWRYSAGAARTPAGPPLGSASDGRDTSGPTAGRPDTLRSATTIECRIRARVEEEFIESVEADSFFGDCGFDSIPARPILGISD